MSAESPGGAREAASVPAVSEPNTTAGTYCGEARMATTLILDSEALNALARAHERPVLAERARAILRIAFNAQSCWLDQIRA